MSLQCVCHKHSYKRERLEIAETGWRESLSGKGVCCRACWPELAPSPEIRGASASTNLLVTHSPLFRSTLVRASVPASVPLKAPKARCPIMSLLPTVKSPQETALLVLIWWVWLTESILGTIWMMGPKLFSTKLMKFFNKIDEVFQLNWWGAFATTENRWFWYRKSRVSLSPMEASCLASDGPWLGC